MKKILKVIKLFKMARKIYLQQLKYSIQILYQANNKLHRYSLKSKYNKTIKK